MTLLSLRHLSTIPPSFLGELPIIYTPTKTSISLVGFWSQVLNLKVLVDLHGRLKRIYTKRWGSYFLGVEIGEFMVWKEWGVIVMSMGSSPCCKGQREGPRFALNARANTLTDFVSFWLVAGEFSFLAFLKRNLKMYVPHIFKSCFIIVVVGSGACELNSVVLYPYSGLWLTLNCFCPCPSSTPFLWFSVTYIQYSLGWSSKMSPKCHLLDVC